MMIELWIEIRVDMELMILEEKWKKVTEMKEEWMAEMVNMIHKREAERETFEW